MLGTFTSLVAGLAGLLQGEVRFEDVTAVSGLPVARSDPSMRNVSGAAAWVDWNDDGWPDLVLGDLGPTRLFLNRGDGTGFDEHPAEALAAVEHVFSIDAVGLVPSTVGDARGEVQDGLVLVNESARGNEVAVVSLGDGGAVVYRGVPTGAAMVASHGDLDGDGSHELLVSDVACGLGFATLRGVVRLDRFPAGYRPPLEGGPFPAPGCTGLPFVTDFDGNGRPVALVVNDFGTLGLPTYVARDSGYEPLVAIFGMGIASTDLNGDGRLDYLISSAGPDSLGLSRPDGGRGWEAAHGPWLYGADAYRFKWGVAYLDADNDGDEEAWLTAGHVPSPGPPSDPNARDLLIVDGVDRAAEAGVDDETEGRVVIPADWNRDGRMDAFVGGLSVWALYENRTEATGHWVALRVPDEPGTVFTLTACGRTTTREWSSGVAGAARERRIHVGLGDCVGPVDVAVRWPWRGTAALGPLAADQEHTVEAPGVVWFEPRIATPGALVRVRSTVGRPVEVGGVTVDGEGTLVAPATEGEHRFPVHVDGQAWALAPRLTVASASVDAQPGRWPARSGETTAVSVVPAGAEVRSGGGRVSGELTVGNDLALEVTGRTVVVPVVAGLDGAGSRVHFERAGETLRFAYAAVDGEGGVVPIRAKIEVTATDAAGGDTTRGAGRTYEGWFATELPATTRTVRVRLGTLEATYAVPEQAGPIDGERSRVHVLEPMVEADGEDLITVGVVLRDKDGLMVPPGPELLPVADGFTAVDQAFSVTLLRLDQSVYTARLRVGTTPGVVPIRVGDFTVHALLVPRTWREPAVLATSTIEQRDGVLRVIPRDRLGQRIGTGVALSPPLPYLGLGEYGASGEATEVTLEGVGVLRYADGQLTRSELPGSDGCIAATRRPGGVPGATLVGPVLALVWLVSSGAGRVRGRSSTRR